MEKLAHYLELRAFQYPSEDPDKVKNTIKLALDIDEETLDEELKAESLESYEGAEIKKYTYRTKRWSKVRETIKRIVKKTKGIQEPEEHLNEEGDFYIRLNKQELCKGNFKISRSGDVVHLKVKIASYPFKINKVKENLKKLLARED